MRQKIGLLPMLFMFAVSACARVASADQFRFSDIENYPTSGTPDQQYQQLIIHGQKYAEEHFPPGFPLDLAIGKLTQAGAQCKIAADAKGQKSYGCEYDHSEPGLAGLFEKTIWMVVVYPDSKMQTVEFITVDTWSDGL